jgi:uncharacterized membrane protein
MVHFPIATLTAAAVAELLFVGTRNPSFAHAARFSVWFGTISALTAGLLGWLFAGLHLVDDRWLMTTHRWLGTGVAASSVLVLILCERSQRSSVSRTAFRVALFGIALLVSATGFFGGALVYGLDHYAWPTD